MKKVFVLLVLSIVTFTSIVTFASSIDCSVVAGRKRLPRTEVLKGKDAYVVLFKDYNFVVEQQDSYSLERPANTELVAVFKPLLTIEGQLSVAETVNDVSASAYKSVTLIVSSRTGDRIRIECTERE